MPVTRAAKRNTPTISSDKDSGRLAEGDKQENHEERNHPNRKDLIRTDNPTTPTMTSTLGAMILRLGNDPPLPEFDGDLSEFEYFYEFFKRTTAERAIPPHVNMERLQKSLKGPAYKLVSAYLHKPSCLEMVVEELRTEYGPKASMTRYILDRCELIPELSAELHNLREFVMGVIMLQTAIDRASDSIGVMVVENLQDKLNIAARISWGTAQIKEGKLTFEIFLNWLKSYRDAFYAGGGKPSGSITEKGRYKIDMKTDIKHEMRPWKRMQPRGKERCEYEENDRSSGTGDHHKELKREKKRYWRTRHQRPGRAEREQSRN